MALRIAVNVVLILVGATLVIGDVFIRSERIRQLLAAFGDRISFRHAFALTAFGDAASAATPWRVGGEVTRIAGARHAGASYPGIAATMTVEAVVVYGMAIIAGVALVSAFGADWWADSSQKFARHLRTLPWTAVGVTAGVVVIIAALFATARFGRWKHEFVRFARVTWYAIRQMRSRSLAICSVLSVVSLVMRVAVLPLLVLDSPDPAPLGLTTLASFALLYAQLLLPTPSGAGPLDFAFAYGAAGVDDGAVRTLVQWRALTTALPVVLGVVAGTVVYGRTLLMFGRRAPTRAAESPES